MELPKGFLQNQYTLGMGPGDGYVTTSPGVQMCTQNRESTLDSSATVSHIGLPLGLVTLPLVTHMNL